MEHRNVAPVKLELFVAVVRKTKAPFYSSIIRSHRVNLQLLTTASGVTHLLLNSLGLISEPKTLIAGVVREDEAQSVIDIFKEYFAKGGDYKGIAFTTELTSVIGTLVYGFLSDEKTTVKTTE